MMVVNWKTATKEDIRGWGSVTVVSLKAAMKKALDLPGTSINTKEIRTLLDQLDAIRSRADELGVDLTGWPKRG